MDLEKILKTDPNSLSKEPVLSSILQQITFPKFLSNITKYPDVYQMLNTYQSFWRSYLSSHYNSFFFKVSSKPGVNWFYETIIASTYNTVKYYYTGEKDSMHSTLASFIPNFQKYEYKVPTELDRLNAGQRSNYTSYYESYLGQFNMNNELDISNFTQDLSKKIKQVVSINDIELYILLSDGDVLYVNGISKNTIIKDVKEMIFKKSKYDYYFIFLTNTGYLYRRKQNDKENVKLITPSDGRITHIQLDWDMTSFIDTLNNIYSIDFGDNEKNYSGYILGIMSRIPHIPFLKGIPVNSFLFVHYGSPREIGLPTGMPERRIGLRTILFYVTTDGKLFEIRFEDYVKLRDPEKVPTFNNVLVKKLYSSKYGRMRRYYEEVNSYFYQDINDNIYAFDIDIENDVKFQLPENSHIKQFIPSSILNFITDDGRLYYYHQDNPFKEYRVAGEPLETVRIIPFESGKSLPVGTTIIPVENSINIILEVPQPSGYVIYPYSLFLVQLIKGNTFNEEVRDNKIIFKMNDEMSRIQPYEFLTGM